ncbi:MAG TPA: rod shape-determining protein [Terricaulis sp.]|nr:rod shape-determining protein [Terricaulis sp.]
MSWTLCVDFGTAFSKAAAAPRDAWARFNPERVRPLMLNQQGEGNPFLLDSAVFVDDDRILFGRAALARAGSDPNSRRAALRSFKTLLSVGDLERALNTSAPVSIDPHRMFSMRDLIALYLSHLTACIARAIGADPELSGADLAMRYAAPAWRSSDGANAHANITRLFGEAAALRLHLGADVLSPGGVDLQAARAGLEATRGAGAPEMGLIFEATAAAAYSSIGLENAASHLIVVDMGAGTTDIAALAATGGRLGEISEARVTLKQAGDFIDGVIANIALDAHGKLKTAAQQAEFWRVIMADMRGFKETLFATGRAALRFDKRIVKVAVKDLERDKDFRLFAGALTGAYERGIGALRDRALADGRREVEAIAVGGGAAAPFIKALVQRKPRNAGKIKVIARPATPAWAHAPAFNGNLAPVFPQLAIAIGGALAPESMIAARGGVSQA